MATIHDVPVEVLRLILDRVANEKPLPAKLHLLLAVCRLWREIALPLVYGQTFIDSSAEEICIPHSLYMDGYIDLEDLTVEGEVKMLDRNERLATVKRLDIYDFLMEAPGFLINIIDAFSLAENESESLGILNERYKLYDVRARPTKELDGKCKRIAQRLARHVATAMPNITELSLMGCDLNSERVICHEYALEFFAELISCYGHRLKSLTHFAPEYFPKPLTMLSLRSLNIMFAYNEGEDEHKHFLKVCPRMLQHVRISGTNLGYYWRLFTSSGNNTACFNNLHTLCFRYEEPLNVFDDKLDANPPALEFPKLENLILRNYSEVSALEPLMCPSLKTIIYSGRPDIAIWLYELQTGPLNLLELDFSGESWAFDNKIMSCMNKLFHGFRGTHAINCTIHIKQVFDIAAMDWPNLTHLTLRIGTNIGRLFKMLPKMPDLIYLRVNIFFHYNSCFHDAIDVLNNLRAAYTNPIKSAVKALHLFAQTRRNIVEFEKAAQNIWWLLPTLELLEVYKQSL